MKRKNQTAETLAVSTRQATARQRSTYDGQPRTHVILAHKTEAVTDFRNV
jgi:hypothetical protein